MRENSFPCGNGADLLLRLGTRLPPGLRLLSSAALDRRSALFPEELPCVERAVEKRINEFSTGRWLARRGLADLGFPRVPIPPGPAREPLWPTGVAASLSHSASVCAFVCGLARDYVSVGLDLELSPVPRPELADLILAPSEPAEYREPEILRLVFSAKEAVYKCLYPIHHMTYDFHDVEIRLRHADNTFTAELAPDGSRSKLAVHGVGMFESSADGAVTLYYLPAAASAVRLSGT